MTTRRGLAKPDDAYQALMDAQAGLSPEDAERFRARLILILADRVGDATAIAEAIAAARHGLGPTNGS
jgi:hypothetical protein